MKISQTLIKEFSNSENPQIFKEKRENKTRKTNKSFSLGLYLDCLLFNPEKCEDEFAISDIELSDKIKDIYDSLIEDGIYVCDNRLLEKARFFNFGRSDWKDETILKKINENNIGEKYLKFCFENKNKIVINTEFKNKADCIIDKLLSNEIFNKYLFVKGDDIESFSQVVLETSINDIPVVIKPDLFIVNHKTKKIKLIDLKSSRNAYRFKEDVIKFKYGLQMSFYSDVLKIIYDGYEIEEHINIVGDTSNCNVYLYKYNEYDLNIEKYGTKWKKGWIYYLNELNWHITNNVWNTTREQKENGFINLNIY